MIRRSADINDSTLVLGSHDRVPDEEIGDLDQEEFTIINDHSEIFQQVIENSKKFGSMTISDDK